MESSTQAATSSSSSQYQQSTSSTTMSSQSQQSSTTTRLPPLPKYATRATIRRETHAILRRLVLQRLAAERQRGRTALLRLTKFQRRRALSQAHILEDIMYQRASSCAEYQDLDTLEERVYKAGRAVYGSARRREEMMREEDVEEDEGGMSAGEGESSSSEDEDDEELSDEEEEEDDVDSTCPEHDPESS